LVDGASHDPSHSDDAMIFSAEQRAFRHPDRVSFAATRITPIATSLAVTPIDCAM